LAVLGAGLVALAALGLGLSLWLGGLDPSQWFIITAGGKGREISGWTITAVLGSVLVAGLLLLVLARQEKRNRLESSRAIEKPGG
jgi:hypothetical protein